MKSTFSNDFSLVLEWLIYVNNSNPIDYFGRFIFTFKKAVSFQKKIMSYFFSLVFV